MSNDNRKGSHSIRPSSPFLKNLSENNGLAIERWPEPVRGELLISEKRHKEPQASAASPDHTAFVTGDLQRLEPPLRQFFQDANVVSEVKEEEM